MSTPPHGCCRIHGMALSAGHTCGVCSGDVPLRSEGRLLVEASVTHTVVAPTYRDARVRAFRVAAEVEARNPTGWPVYVQGTRVTVELIHGGVEETARAEKILATAVRKVGR